MIGAPLNSRRHTRDRQTDRGRDRRYIHLYCRGIMAHAQNLKITSGQLHVHSLMLDASLSVMHVCVCMCV